MSKASCIWWAQRVSAVALIPLVIWFVSFVLSAIEFRDIDIISSMFVSPFITISLALFLAVGLYHGNIGIREIIEDYVHCNALKIGLIIFIKFISIISSIASICAILVLHLAAFNFY